MSPFEFASKYSSDDTMREKLYPLFETVFQIEVRTLLDFHARGFWNTTYQPYTFFDGDVAVANVSMFSMPLMMKQKMSKVAAVQSVMTHPEYRGKGLMKLLFEKMLLDIDAEFETALLLTEVPELYHPFGFRQVREHYFVAPMKHVPKQGNPGARKLDFFNEDDVRIVRDCFQNHTPISHHFAPLSHDSSFYLNMYRPYYHEKLYYSEELNVVMVFKVEGGTLHLYDVIGKRLPSLEELCSQIPQPFSQIVFYFYPDLFNVPTFEPVATGSHLMVRGRFEVENDYFTLPITASF
jgi:GNAT superfamily N-acetyltransferase